MFATRLIKTRKILQYDLFCEVVYCALTGVHKKNNTIVKYNLRFYKAHNNVKFAYKTIIITKKIPKKNLLFVIIGLGHIICLVAKSILAKFMYK